MKNPDMFSTCELLSNAVRIGSVQLTRQNMTATLREKNADYLRYERDQEIKRANEVKMKLDSYDACCDTEHCIEAFVAKRIREYLKMSRLDRCRVVVEQMKKVKPEDAASLEQDLDEFFKTRNLLCHEPGAVDKTDHPSFHQRCVSIQHCVEYFEKQSD
ncbi:hypothetical protein PR001_g29547 [Phytophthora rubi]|uniref:RiboL-PSP-HEPN domain-containing protein n=1 Tax=Phytophthora rubi TaxID=129364 RepID=A0A6A3H133_9STRA|nr:hypothetical protein PR001_g29547 [Phytophthora rubi]